MAVLASGTSDAEYATDAVAAGELVTRWDRIHLHANTISLSSDQSSTFTFVTGSVFLPTKNKQAIEMFLAAVPGSTGKHDWAWQALFFSPKGP